MRIEVNGEQVELAEAITVAELLAQLSIRPGPIAVEVNAGLVPRQDHAQHRLSEGDRVEIVTLVGGG